MGVPGDMNLELLDYIKNVDGLKWGHYAHLLNATVRDMTDGYLKWEMQTS